MRAALTDAAAALGALYGERLRRLVLFGSQVRGDTHAESDVDVLVVLDGEVDYLAEVRRMLDLMTELLHRYDLVVSLKHRAPGITRGPSSVPCGGGGEAVEALSFCATAADVEMVFAEPAHVI